MFRSPHGYQTVRWMRWCSIILVGMMSSCAAPSEPLRSWGEQVQVVTETVNTADRDYLPIVIHAYPTEAHTEATAAALTIETSLILIDTHHAQPHADGSTTYPTIDVQYYATALPESLTQRDSGEARVNVDLPTLEQRLTSVTIGPREVFTQVAEVGAQHLGAPFTRVNTGLYLNVYPYDPVLPPNTAIMWTATFRAETTLIIRIDAATGEMIDQVIE